MKILWERDKVHFTSSNLVCVYTHPKFQNMKFSLSIFDKIFKNPTHKFFLCQNRKSELSIDWLIISVPLLTYGVRKRQKFYVKNESKSVPERPFEFRLSMSMGAAGSGNVFLKFLRNIVELMHTPRFFF